MRVACVWLCVLSVVLAGCGGKTDAPPPTPSGVSNAPTASTAKVRAGMVLDTGGVDDRSFNAAAWAGLQDAQKKLGLGDKDIKYIESKDAADYKTNLTNLTAQNYDIVFAIGYKMAGPLAEVAPQFPNVKYAIVDADAPKFPNCAGLTFKEQEGTFLAGFLAASVSKSKKIGFVGGEQIPLIEKFEAGYKAGAKMADPTVTVTATYTGDWNDESKGRSQADQQYGSGADIVFQAAGKAGLGVIEAARTRGKGYYAIGVDQDQDYIAPGNVLTSVVKHLDTAVSDMVQKVAAGKFTPGTSVYGLKENGVGLSEMKYTKQVVPADVQTRLDKIKQMIIDGQIVPPTSLKELATFQPPKI
jgi:basic membrane protein A and related proteins